MIKKIVKLQNIIIALVIIGLVIAIVKVGGKKSESAEIKADSTEIKVDTTKVK
jgi:hypothetical protein